MGYSWLVGSMTPGGMYLFVTREFPGGMGVRPLLACKIGEEEKLWSSVNWNIVNKRLDITAGGNLEPVEGTKQRGTVGFHAAHPSTCTGIQCLLAKDAAWQV